MLAAREWSVRELDHRKPRANAETARKRWSGAVCRPRTGFRIARWRSRTRAKCTDASGSGKGIQVCSARVFGTTIDASVGAPTALAQKDIDEQAVETDTGGGCG
jgi:hypothetical protein